jgi:O-antigen/teichoic acid export membrane protein
MNSRVTNILWIGFEKFGLILFSAVSFFTFAFYLTPTQLGIGAFTIVICELITSFLGASFENPLVRRGCQNKQELSSVFWLGSLMALAATAFVGITYYLIFDSSIVGVMIVVSSVSVMTSIQSRPYIASLRCQRQFKSLALRTLWGKIIGGAVAILAAINGAGAWALLIQLITMNAVGLMMLIYSNPKLMLCRPKVSDVDSLLREGLPVGYRKLLTGAFDRGIIIILAIVTNNAVVGYYSFARRLVELPRQALDSALVSYSLPAFTSRTSNNAKASKLFQDLTLIVLFICFPVFTFMGVFGSQILTDIFGDKWEPAIEYFLLIAILANFQLISILVPPLQAAFGKSSLGLKADILKVTILLSLSYLVGLAYGAIGIIAVMFVESIVNNIIRLNSTHKLLSLSKFNFYKNILSLLFIALSLGLGSYAITLIPNIDLTLIELIGVGAGALLIYILLTKFVLNISIGNIKKLLRS